MIGLKKMKNTSKIHQTINHQFHLSNAPPASNPGRSLPTAPRIRSWLRLVSHPGRSFRYFSKVNGAHTIPTQTRLTQIQAAKTTEAPQFGAELRLRGARDRRMADP